MAECGAYSSLSTFFSTLSLISWIFAQLPQIYSNYANKSADGIAPLFLLLWFLGDFLSFTSCLLNTMVLKFQIYLSLFFICNDVMLCFQYYYYNSVYPRKYAPVGTVEYSMERNNDGENQGISHDTELYDNGVMKNNIAPSTTTESVHFRHPDAHETVSGLSSTPQESLSSTSPEGSYNSINDNRMDFARKGIIASMFNTGTTHALSVAERPDNPDIVSILTGSEALGLFLAWACTCVYMGSRCPQLYKNYKRKSVEGISPLLFGSALLGNLCYTLSILTSCDFMLSDNRTEFFFKELPYMLGSVGTVLFDIAYFYQRHIYRYTGINTTAMNLDSWDIEDEAQ